jgi:hypothetical protein
MAEKRILLLAGDYVEDYFVVLVTRIEATERAA